MIHEIPKSESLKDTLARSRVYWDEVLAPSLQQGKTLLVVGHENNLRSLIMRLEGISERDIIELSIPRAVPLAYRLDENLQPLTRMDGKLDEATGMLRGEWLGGDKAVADILDRDNKQVYDTTINKNLEKCNDRDQFNNWVNEIMNDTPPPENIITNNNITNTYQNGITSPPVNGVKKHHRLLNGVSAVGVY
jgi:broad specificity phosphatase PhoE